MSARKTVSPILPSIAVVLAIAGITTLLPLPAAFTDTAHARNHKPYRGDTPPVTRSGVTNPPGSGGKFGGNAIPGGPRIDLGWDFKPSGPRAQHQDHRGGARPPVVIRTTAPAQPSPPRKHPGRTGY